MEYIDQSRAVYGIDLGTTYSCIAQVDKYDQAVVLTNFEGDQTTPSAVYFEDEKNVIVGAEAKGMLTVEPNKTVVCVKRMLGVDEHFDKQYNTLPYHYDPTEVSALILKKLVQDANDLGYNPVPVKDVVITCPAYFGTKERMQTKQAGEMAGLNVLAVINEPTAAAIAYGMKTEQKKTVLVYDLGGGTFDVTIINVNNGAIKVIATGGDHHLGGVDWDSELANYMLDQFNEQNATYYTMYDELLKYTLLLEAEKMKKTLTAKEAAMCTIQYDGLSARFEVTRAIFEMMTASLLDETISATRKVIDIAREKGYTDTLEFLLVGGSSRMPQVKRRIEEEFGCDAKMSDPDQCVAKGAAIYALNSAYTKTVDNYNKGLIDERPLPLKGPRARVVNVTSKTYGTRLYNKEGKLVVYNMIFANTPLPVEVIEPASTRVDNQKFLAITVYESDFTDPVADYQVEERFCVKLEERNLELNKNWPKGTPCDVKFSLNEEGILAVHCEVDKDKIDFELTITGVKTQEEMEKSTIAIGKTVVS